MKKRLAFVALSAMLAVAPAALGQGTLYAVQESNDTFVKFDPNTLQKTTVGPLNAIFNFGGLSWAESSQTMYMTDGRGGRNGLWTVDINTGQASPVGTFHGLPEMFSVEWDSSTNTLYGGQSTQAQGFYRFDTTSGQAFLIGNPVINLDGLAYDSSRDMMVGAYAGPGDLYEINRSNGSATLLAAGDFFDNCGFTYDRDRDIFWMLDWGGNMYTFDPNNNYARTLVASGLGAHDGLAYVPDGPPSLRITVTGQCPGTVTVAWNNATPSRTAGLVFARNQGNVVIPSGPCRGTQLGLGSNQIQLVRQFNTGPNGSGQMSGNAGVGACGGFLQVVVADGSPCDTSNVGQIP